MNKITVLKNNVTVLGDIPLDKEGLMNESETYTIYFNDPTVLQNVRTRSTNLNFAYATRVLRNYIIIHHKYSDKQKEEMLKEYFDLKEIIS